MAITSNRIKVAELDFDSIKSNLKNFMQGQEQFSDYDFEGSGLNILLDVLAYNTHYNALYLNLSVNEMFLDSASKRSSVVSLAKGLGYTPKSAVAPTASVRITVTNPTSFPTALLLPKHSPFVTTVDGLSYTYYNKEEILIINENDTFIFDNVTITEGVPLSFKYTVADGQKYIIPNVNADLTTLTVKVQESSSSDTFYTYIPASSIVELASDARVYFVKEIDGGLFEISFGDGIISSELTNGNVVHLNYFSTSKTASNGSRIFGYGGATLIGGTVVVTTLSPAAGGSEPESIESIKFNAPKLYAAQNRAVTVDDYKALIYSNFPYIKSVSVWGGEDNNPPIYGKAFICVKPYEAVQLTNQQKSDITVSLLGSRTVVSITPEVVDPEYIDIAMSVVVYYDDRKTTKTSKQIEAEVVSSILSYNDTDLQNFDGVFRYSKISRLIDMSEQSIVNNISTILLKRHIIPRYNISAEYKLDIINPIYSAGVQEDALTSNGFYIQGSEQIHYLQDDGVGKIILYYKIGSIKTIVNSSIGTVNYSKGVINIKNLNIVALVDSVFELTIKPSSNDVVSAYTQIVQIDTNQLVVTAIADKTINGDLRAGKNYVFTASR